MVIIKCGSGFPRKNLLILKQSLQVNKVAYIFFAANLNEFKLLPEAAKAV